MNNTRAYLFHLLVLLLIQVIILENIHLGSLFRVNIYIMALFLLPYRMKGIPLLLCGFALGLFMDVVDNSPGIHAAASTLVAYIRPRLLQLTSSREAADDARISFRYRADVGWFFKQAFLSTLFFHVALVFAEAFTFQNLLLSCARVVFSTLVTILFILLYYFIGLRKVRE
jgi:rod shape-determining protein MreD